MISPIVMAIVVAGYGLWQLRRLRHLDPVADARDEAGAARRVSVVIPARNEAASLPALLTSLGAQARPADEVIVVDDESTDDTALVAARHGATVIAAPDRPDGWLGKPWACAAGARAAEGDLLVFLDADVSLGPDALTRLMGAHARSGGLVSVQPHHRALRWWEQASAFPNLLSILATGALRPHPSGPPVAFGPCLVTDRADYDAAGTHQAVAGEVIEDIQLARAYHRCGLPVTAFLGDDDVTFRMYPEGPGQLVEGWTKNLAGGPGLTVGAPMLLAVAWMLAMGSVVGTFASGVLAGRPLALVPWVIVAAAMSSMLRRIGSFRWWAGPAFPVLWVVFLLLFVRSAVAKARGTATWRGRRLSLRGS